MAGLVGIFRTDPGVGAGLPGGACAKPCVKTTGKRQQEEQRRMAPGTSPRRSTGRGPITCAMAASASVAACRSHSTPDQLQDEGLALLQSPGRLPQVYLAEGSGAADGQRFYRDDCLHPAGQQTVSLTTGSSPPSALHRHLRPDRRGHAPPWCSLPPLAPVQPVVPEPDAGPNRRWRWRRCHRSTRRNRECLSQRAGRGRIVLTAHGRRRPGLRPGTRFQYSRQ